MPEVQTPTLTVLGCDGSYPGPGGAASGYLVEAEGVVLWLDAGPGTFANLQLVRDPRTVDMVILSHEHPDHWSDLESFAVWRHHLAGSPAIPVYAPPGLRRRSYFGEDPVFSWNELEPGDRFVVQPRYGRGGGGLALSFAATDHGPPTLAVRVDPLGGPGAQSGLAGSLAYTADTGPEWSVEALGAGIGTVLCEATYTREHEGGWRHLSGRQAGTMAAAAGADRLVLTHRWPSIPAEALAAEADDAFGRPVHQMTAGRVVEW